MVARAALGFDNATVPGLRIEVGRGVAGRVAESGRPAVVDDLSTVETAGPILRSRGVQSLVCVPLLIDGRVTGVVQAGSLRSRHFTGDEVQLLQLVADRAATAIERSQLYEAEQAARAEAEAVQQRVAFLAEASRRLAASLHYEATLTTVARLAVPTLADWCLVDVLEDGGSIRTVAAAHVDPAREPPLLNLRRQYTPDPSGDTPVARVLRIGESVLSPVLPDAAPEALARDAEHLALLRALGPSPISGMVVPLVSRGQTVGAISFAARESGRRYGPEDLALAEDLARRAAAAVDNALLYQETLAASARGHEHAARLRKLAEAALDVTSALTLGDRLQIITERARDIIGAHQAATDVVEGDHDGSRVSTVSLSDKDGAWRDNREPAIGSELTALVRTENRPRRLSEAELKQHPAWQGIGRQAETHPPMRGWLAAPLVGRDGRNLGLIQLSDRHDGEFTEEDEAILVQLAQMASAAIEHARLQQQASAAAAAVEADRLKTELLSTVSHELRTPLAAIKGFTTTMVAYFDRLVREDQLSFLREIDGAADRLHELVENLLRLSRLEAGTLDIRREPLALASVLVRSLEDARRRFLDRVITLELAGTLPAVRADARRIEQVVANLIDNAVKYSPEGGEVEIRARPSAAGGVEFSVTDHGIGIAAEHLERVFERFYRVDSSVTAEIGGTGLGLAICRRIVEAHGGAIAAASREGQGSTFTVTLPPA
jgi:signal transduction histidine kinase